MLSESISKALYPVGGNEGEEKAKFSSLMAKFFDCMNVGNFTKGKLNQKPFQGPYRSATDFRLKVSS